MEQEIRYSTGLNGDEPHFEPNDKDNIKTVNTCALLNRLHKGYHKNTTDATATLRHDIQKRHTAILNMIIAWQHATDNNIKYQYERELKGLLSRKSAFTMLMRSMLSVFHFVPKEFFD